MLKNVFYVLMLIGLLELSQAQRPSFAGARPPGGLSQKDKYHATQNTAVENITGVDIATRFGADNLQPLAPSINLAYGAPQKPPVGVPLVLPISAYVPDAAPTAAAAPTPASVANRFGGASGASDASSDQASLRPIAASFRPIAASNAQPIASNALPIDAHGDRDYVNQLSQLPVDNQPFWFLNYQAIEALRNSSRPNVGALETRGSFFGG